TRRGAGAGKRIEALAQDAAKTDKALVGAREAPQAIEGRKFKLMGELGMAEARRGKGAGAPAGGERTPTEPDRAAKAADHAASEARERRAAGQARQEAGAAPLAE